MPSAASLLPALGWSTNITATLSPFAALLLQVLVGQPRVNEILPPLALSHYCVCPSFSVLLSSTSLRCFCNHPLSIKSLGRYLENTLTASEATAFSPSPVFMQSMISSLLLLPCTHYAGMSWQTHCGGLATRDSIALAAQSGGRGQDVAGGGCNDFPTCCTYLKS